MKTLIIGLLALTSTLAYSRDSREYGALFNGDDVTVVVSGNSERILGAEQNADFFCLSKGFDSSYEHTVKTISAKVSYDILPNGQKYLGWVSNDVAPKRLVLESVHCVKKINKP